MRVPSLLTFSAIVPLLTAVQGRDIPNVTPRGAIGAIGACASISSKLSGASSLYFPVSANYVGDTHHYILSSTQLPACVVEVGSSDDTATVLKIIGSTKTPFAVLSGGHTSNQGFSSTTGVLINLKRLNGFTKSPDNKSVVIGTGGVWTDDVYPKLDGSGYTVAGGRVAGPGVGGVTLGGGFSWYTNQYGLGCDNIQSYTLVLPNGTVATIDSKQSDLFFALKGGLNRFGIVTEIKYNLLPASPQVWGGYATYPLTSKTALLKAVNTFAATNTDPKAQVILTLAYYLGVPSVGLIQFYDGPQPGASLAPFAALPILTKDLSARSLSSLAKSSPTALTANGRGAFHTLSTSGLTEAFIAAVSNETDFFGQLSLAHSGVFISYECEPLLHGYGDKTTDSAYPHAASPLPLFLFFTWTSPAEDAFWLGKMQGSIDYLKTIAVSEGIYAGETPGQEEKLVAYPNYAPKTYAGAQLYGSANAARLRAVKAAVDPAGVMDLTGGFKL